MKILKAESVSIPERELEVLLRGQNGRRILRKLVKKIDKQC